MSRAKRVVEAEDVLQEAQDRGLVSFRPVLEEFRDDPDVWVHPPSRAEANELRYQFRTWTVWEIYEAFKPERERDSSQEDT